MSPPDLTRVRDVLRRLSAMMTDPTLSARTAAMLRGEIACPELEIPHMTKNTVQTTVRLPAELVRRLEKMEATMGKDPALAAFRISFQSVMRTAIARGLDAMEAEKRGNL